MVKLFCEQAWFLIGLKYFNFIRIKMNIVKIQLIKNQNAKNFSFKLQGEQWHAYCICVEGPSQCTGKLFAAFRGIRDTKIEKSRGIQDKISLPRQYCCYNDTFAAAL